MIALPGETIEYKNDVLFINGKQIAEPYLDEYKRKAKAAGIQLTGDLGPIDMAIIKGKMVK